jgi:uncharacterized membrane protein
MSTVSSRSLAALALQWSALAALCLSLLGFSWLDARGKPRLLVLMDRSQSVPRTLAESALAEVVQAAKAGGAGELQWLEFAGRPASPSPISTPGTAELEPSATNIASALEAALAAHAEAAFAGAVVISDGLANLGDTERALRAVRDAGLPLQWLAVGRAPPRTRLAEVLAPDRALAGQRIQVVVQLAGPLDPPLRVKATARTPTGEIRTESRETAGAGAVTIDLDAGRGGAVVVDLALEEPASGRLLDAMPDAAVIDVAPRAGILYVQGSAGPLAHSLLQGGWKVQSIPATRLDAHADGLDGYQAVVLDDVAIADASPRLWHALANAVHDRGLGLLVLGGERSFARGGYRESVLESVLPVLSEPAALDRPAAIVFAVDKSGSMGQGSGGVDRFALAQRAVLETARGLTERDALGLVVFDVEPRVLVPVGPAAAARQALERSWPATPNGGTKLAPALEAAIRELERSAAARRLLVLVTDGFVDDAPLEELRAQLDRSRIETIALAVGPDADIGALQRLAGTQAGTVLRVNQAAELPQVMRAGLEQRRARVERGTLAATQLLALPFPPGWLQDWPPVEAHFATRPRPDATVAVQSQRGEPLIAFQRFGHGRVMAVTSGLGPWTPQWLQWRQWPGLAGGLAAWISGTTDGAAIALSVFDRATGLQLEADVTGRAGPPRTDGVSMTVDTPKAQRRPVTLEPVAPGRLSSTLADDGTGLYTFQVSGPHGTRRQLHLRRQRAEDRTWGTNPALEAWQAEGLVGRWDPLSVAHRGAGDRQDRPVDRSLLGLALVLFLSGVVVDRTRWDSAALRRILRRWRRPA